MTSFSLNLGICHSLYFVHKNVIQSYLAETETGKIQVTAKSYYWGLEVEYNKLTFQVQWCSLKTTGFE